MVDWILEAAMRLLSGQGYEATTTNKIAELAGVSIGSLYHYFPNKDAILLELGIRHRKLIYRDIIKILKQGKGTDFREVLKGIITRIVHLHRQNPLFIEALAVHTRIDKQLDAMAYDQDLKFWAAVGVLIKRTHEDQGLTTNPDELRQAWIMLGKTGKDVIHNIAIEPAYGPDDKIIDDLVEVILSYLNKHSSGKQTQ